MASGDSTLSHYTTLSFSELSSDLRYELSGWKEIPQERSSELTAFCPCVHAWLYACVYTWVCVRACVCVCMCVGCERLGCLCWSMPWSSLCLRRGLRPRRADLWVAMEKTGATSWILRPIPWCIIRQGSAVEAEREGNSSPLEELYVL